MFRYVMNSILSFLGLLEYINPNASIDHKPESRKAREYPNRSLEKIRIREAEAKRQRKNIRRAREYYSSIMGKKR